MFELSRTPRIPGSSEAEGRNRLWFALIVGAFYGLSLFYGDRWSNVGIPIAFAVVYLPLLVRVLFGQALTLVDRPRRRRLELSVTGRPEFIALPYALVGLNDAVDLLLKFGGFEDSAAD